MPGPIPASAIPVALCDGRSTYTATEPEASGTDNTVVFDDLPVMNAATLYGPLMAAARSRSASPSTKTVPRPPESDPACTTSRCDPTSRRSSASAGSVPSTRTHGIRSRLGTPATSRSVSKAALSSMRARSRPSIAATVPPAPAQRRRRPVAYQAAITGGFGSPASHRTASASTASIQPCRSADPRRPVPPSAARTMSGAAGSQPG
ncbi:hypothetical protein ACF07V_36740 [Streptomyces sp. NPDC015661]|uniref:hypothetical protein n=1 Tax=Streptomyces sp. NPDC015661 TaxID=3364961 RepID=UPI0036FB2304